MATYTTPYRSFNVTSTFNAVTDVYNTGSTGVSFDFSGIPPGSTINSAKLYLSHNQTSTYIYIFSVNGSSYYSGMNVAAQVGGNKIYTFRFASKTGTETRTISVSSARIVVDYTPAGGGGGGGDPTPPGGGSLSAPTGVYFDDVGGPIVRTMGPGALTHIAWNGWSPGLSADIYLSEGTDAIDAATFYGTATNNYLAIVPSSSTNGMIRIWRIRIKDSNGNVSPLSTAFASLTTSWGNPSMPPSVSLSSYTTTPLTNVTLSWGASSAGTNNPVTGYLVEVSTNNSTWSAYSSVGASTRSISVTSSDTNGQTYYFRVKATGQYGDSIYNGPVELTTIVQPLSAPTGVKIDNSTALTIAPSTGAQISWNGVPGGTNNSVTGYEVFYSTSPNSGYNRLTTLPSSARTCPITSTTTEGTGYYKVRATGSQAHSPLSAYASVTVSYTTAEAATFTVSPSNVVAGTTATITITSKTDKIQKIKITFGSTSSGTLTVPAGTGIHYYNIPMSWCSQIPNSTSGTANIVVETYDGTVLKGKRSSSFYVSVPSTVVPTIASFTGTRVNNSVPSGWGVYVVSKSQVALAMGNGSGSYGSTITNYRLSGGGLNLLQTTPISATSPVLSSTATTFTATVTDSRNRSSSYTVSATALTYSAPTLATTSFRCNSSGVEDVEGTYGSAKVVSTFASVGGRNSVTITARYRVKGSAGVWTSIGTLTNNTATVFGGGNLAQNSYYEVEYTVVDQLGVTVKYVDDISTSQYIMHYKPGGKGLGIGGAWSDDNTLDVHWATKFHQGISTESAELVTNLNADKLDGKHGSEFLEKTGGTMTGPLVTPNAHPVTIGAFNRLTNWANQLDGKPFVWHIHIDSNNGVPVLGWTDGSGTRSLFSITNRLSAYPVGAIYMSLTSTSPATLFGGTWAAIGAGRFLVAAGTGYAAGATGGVSSNTLSVNQLPVHDHPIRNAGGTLGMFLGAQAGSGQYGVILDYSGQQGTPGDRMVAAGTGGGTSVENRPPYYAVYMWRRTA